MAVTMAEDNIQRGRPVAQELIGDLAERLNDTRPIMRLDGAILAGLAGGMAVDAAFGPSVQGHGLLGVCRYLLLALLVVCWLRSIILLVLAGRPILGIVCDHRWRAGAPLDPRARWLHLPPIEATEDEWIWVRAHMLVGAARIRMERVQSSLTWALLTTAVFLLWLVTAFLAQ